MLALPFIGQRNDHQDALGAGLGVTEFAPEGKASEEIVALWGWISERLIVESNDHGQAALKTGVQADPLVQAVLARFPGAEIVDVREGAVALPQGLPPGDADEVGRKHTLLHLLAVGAIEQHSVRGFCEAAYRADGFEPFEVNRLADSRDEKEQAEGCE